MTILFPIAASFLLATAATTTNTGFVDNPEKCEAQWQIRLERYRIVTRATEGWPEQLILDANKGGDFKMAQRYMAKFGWFSAATRDPNDLTLYFMPDLEPAKSTNPLFVARPVANLAEGLKRACYAAWISGVPFVRVTKRGEVGEGVLYSVTTDNMPVRDY